jgi:ankyrin repeat protein
MKKATAVMAIVLSALLLESAVARAAHQFLHRTSCTRPIIAALVSAASQSVAGSGPEQEFLKAVSQGREADVSRLLEENPRLAFASESHGISALMLAIYGQRSSVVKLILDRRQDGLSVFEAAALGQDDVLQSLLTRTPGLAKEYGPDGFTALHLSAYFGHRLSMERLLRAGADIDAYSHNKFHACTLQSAAAATQLEAARVLLTKGANPNCRGDGGYSPLHEAAGSGQLELARLLLQHKADVSAKGDDGKTPLDVAVEEKQSAILGLLKEEAK